MSNADTLLSTFVEEVKNEDAIYQAIKNSTLDVRVLNNSNINDSTYVNSQIKSAVFQRLLDDVNSTATYNKAFTNAKPSIGAFKSALLHGMNATFIGGRTNKIPYVIHKKYLNKLRPVIPNFQYVHAYSEWIENKQNYSMLLVEDLTGCVPMTSLVRDSAAEEECIFQVLGALTVAQSYCMYMNNTLYPANVYVKKLNNTITIRYPVYQVDGLHTMTIITKHLVIIPVSTMSYANDGKMIVTNHSSLNPYVFTPGRDLLDLFKSGSNRIADRVLKRYLKVIDNIEYTYNDNELYYDPSYILDEQQKSRGNRFMNELQPVSPDMYSSNYQGLPPEVRLILQIDIPNLYLKQVKDIMQHCRNVPTVINLYISCAILNSIDVHQHMDIIDNYITEINDMYTRISPPRKPDPKMPTDTALYPMSLKLMTLLTFQFLSSESAYDHRERTKQYLALANTQRYLIIAPPVVYVRFGSSIKGYLPPKK